MFVDTHAHLDFPQFNSDRDEVILRAKNAGVEKIINVGCNIETSMASLDLAKKYVYIWATCGIHPHDAHEVSDQNLEILRKLARNEKVVAIGEIGLDYFRMKNTKEVQCDAFRRQLQLAMELDLPVIVHCRDADADCLQILEDEQVKKVVFHCFGGDYNFAKKVWSRGFWTSFTGNITFRNAVNLKEVVKNVPLDMFMIETDCPFLAPQKFRGKRNEPSYVIEVAKEIANLKNIDTLEIKKISAKNAEKFFGLQRFHSVTT